MTDDADLFAARLTACDEALAAGATPDAADTPADLQDRLRRGVDCLRRLRRAWPDPTPTKLARFEIRRELGRGSYGVVFLAYDPRLRREVALKVPRAEALLTAELRDRFLNEARIAAGLDHPNLVPVYEVGEDGPVCYIAAAYCPGMTLAAWLKGQAEPVPPRLAARLVADLAGAVHYAHTRGVIHRDLKPANVLLASGGCEPPGPEPAIQGGSHPPLAPTPKITDFGLAKLVAAAEDARTQTGAILGTPAYMAPEQAGGRSRAVGPAADVWALGVILYELLAGRTPFQGESVLDTLDAVRGREPVAPSRLRPGLPRDLETTCLKCLEREPARRYPSAAALADDLARYLDGRPVVVRRPGPVGRLVKWARRRPAAAAAAALATVALAALGAAAAGWFQQGRVRAALQVAEAERRRTDQARYASDMLLAGRAWRDANVRRLADLLDRQVPVGADQPDWRGFEWRYLHRLAEAARGGELGRHTGPALRVAFSPDGRWLASGGQDGWVRVWDVAGRRCAWGRQWPAADVHGLAFSPDGRSLAVGGTTGAGGFVALLPVAEAGRSATALSPQEPDGFLAYDVAFSRDGARLAAAGVVPESGPDRVRRAARFGVGMVRVWELGTGGRPAEFRDGDGMPAGFVPRAARAVAFSDDGRRLAWGDMANAVHVAAADGRGPVRHLRDAHPGGNFVYSVAFRPGGGEVASAGEDGTVRVWDADTGRLRFALDRHAQPVRAVAYGPDGRLLASAGSDHTARVWDADTGREVAELRGHADTVQSVAVAPGGRLLATAGGDGAVRLWELDARPEFRPLAGHRWEVTGVAFGPNGLLVSSGEDATVRCWDAAAGRAVRTLAGPANLFFEGVAVSPDGRWVAAAGRDRSAGQRGHAVLVWDLSRPGDAPADRRTTDLPALGVAFSPDGGRLAFAVSEHHENGPRGGVSVWAFRSGGEPVPLAGADAAFGVAFDAGGAHVAAAGADGAVRVYAADTGALVRTLRGHRRAVRAVAFDRGGRLASASWDRTAVVWDWERGEAELTLRGHKSEVTCLAFSPDGRRLVTAGEDMTLRLWEVEAGQEVLALPGHTRGVRGVAFDPAGQRIASAGIDSLVCLWDAR